MPQKGHRNSKAQHRSMATDTAKPQPQQQSQPRSTATAAKKMRGRSCMIGLSDLCRKLSGGMGLVLVLLLSGVISEELGLNVTRNRLIVSELHLEGSSA